MTARYLRGNQGTETPTNLVFFDTECHSHQLASDASKRILSLRLWCATYVRLENDKPTRRKEAYGDDWASFWDFVDQCASEDRCTWLFAHNLGFDLTQLHFWHLLDLEYFTTKPLLRKPTPDGQPGGVSWIGKLCLENHPTFMQVRYGLKTFRMVDTCNYWPKSLGKVGLDVGIPKGEMPAWDAPANDWLQYCKSDVAIIEKAICDLLIQWRREDCGVFQVTAPMLAMQNFRHKCDVRTPDGKDVDIVCEPDSPAHDLERAAYYGGRIQCFQIGEIHGKLFKVDCNSLYPYVMRNNLFPRRLVRTQNGISPDNLRRESKCFSVVAQVSIRSRDCTYPVRIDGRQYHCKGKFFTSLCGAELQRGLDSGHVNTITEVQFYSMSYLFRGWVDYWHNRKISESEKGKASTGEREFAKLILNSLSGKFAQHGKRWIDRPGRIPLEKWGAFIEIDQKTGKPIVCRGVGGNYQMLTDDGEPAHSFPLISAYITSYAREYMRWVIGVAGEENCYYMATDSLIVNAEGYMNMILEDLIHPTQLGKFKVEGQANYCKIVGPTYYEFGDKTVASGIVGRYAKAEDDGRVPELFEQLVNIIASGPKDDIIVTQFDKPNLRPDIRGILDSNNRWTPYRLSHDDDFTDRVLVPPHSGYCSSGKQGDRILLVSDV